MPRREEDEAPGRTPQQAEGEDGAERRVPAGEPGKTPGSAEGEDGRTPRRLRATRPTSRALNRPARPGYGGSRESKEPEPG